MIDPLKLAACFDAFEREDGTEFGVYALRESDARLIVSALRGMAAEIARVDAEDALADGRYAIGRDDLEAALMVAQDRVEQTRAAFRAAREGS